MDEGFEAAAIGFRVGLGFVFLSASIPKLLAPAQFARAVRNYRLLPPRLNEPVAAWLPRLELTLAVALLLGFAARVAAGLLAAMLIVFAAAVAINLARGREIDCGCLTTPSPRRIGWGLVAGDLGLAAMAGSVAVADPDALSLLPLGADSSLLGNETGLALAITAALLVLGHLVVSSWLSLRAAIRAMEGHGEVVP
jgi:uncharacterized membrane protein YphA (DoxX/SURF4 family)